MSTQAVALPRRPKRRLITPVTGGLAAVLVAALGFLGGVQVQKRHGTSTASGAVPSFGTGGPPSGAGFGAQQGTGSGTSGTVAYVKHGLIYVKNADGTTVKVKVDGNTKVTRTASTTSAGVHPGDTVTVQGATSGDTVKATSLTATAD